MTECVVFVHGIWMTGLEMFLLRRRVTRQGYRCFSFRYSSISCSPEANAQALSDFVATLVAEYSPLKVHLVAHSLGGIVISHLIHRHSLPSLGRVVLLGSPLVGSATATAYSRFFLTRVLLGKSIEEGLLGGQPDLPEDVEVGVIAGTKGIGVGTVLFGALPKPNDGTVAVAETLVRDLSDHCCVPYSHFSMLLAPSVAIEVVAFLKAGKFSAKGDCKGVA